MVCPPGLVGAAFRVSPEQADRLRNALITRAHGGNVAGLLPGGATRAAVTAVAARPARRQAATPRGPWAVRLRKTGLVCS